MKDKRIGSSRHSGDTPVEVHDSDTSRLHARELGWRAYQPSWSEALVSSVVVCSVYGGLSFYRTGNLVAIEVAAVMVVPVCIFVRWLYPMFKHLVWGDRE
jgi:hypothetical protein